MLKKDLMFTVCTDLHNYFFHHEDAPIDRTFEIKDGKFSSLDFLSDGQYFLVLNSKFNDGIYKYNDDEFNGTLIDETFEGTIRKMYIPSVFVNLCDDILAWITKYADEINSPYNSESFGGYSYSKSTATGDGSNAVSWKSVFKSQLSVWKKVHF